MAKVRVARELLEKQFWPGEEYRVRITSASYADGYIILGIEGENIPERGYVRALTISSVRTEFKPE